MRISKSMAAMMPVTAIPGGADWHPGTGSKADSAGGEALTAPAQPRTFPADTELLGCTSGSWPSGASWKGEARISVRIPTPLLVQSWDLPVCHLPNWGMSCSQLSLKTGWPGPKASTA